MLGEVPICVISPPSSEPNAIGIRNTDGEVPDAAGELEGDRDHDRQRADVLDEGRQHGDDGHQQDELRADPGHVRRIALDGELHDAGPRDAGADQKRAADDDDDVVAEAGERRIIGHDADGECDEQRAAGDEVIAEATPDKRRHHQSDDGEGENLIDCHRPEVPSLGLAMSTLVAS